MKKFLPLCALCFLSLFLLGCTSSNTLTTTQEIDIDALKKEIKKEVLAEVKQDLEEQMNNKVEDLEEAFEGMEDNVEDLETDQDDLENLFDITNLEITTQGESNQWNFTLQGDELTRRIYPTDIIRTGTPYTVLIEQLSNEYKITNKDFDITLTSQQCSFSDNGVIYAYFVTIIDANKQELNGCANVKL